MIWGLPSTTDSQKAAAGSNPSESDLSSNSGVILMAEYTQGNFFGGFNKLSVTYGTDGFAYAASSTAATTSVTHTLPVTQTPGVSA